MKHFILEESLTKEINTSRVNNQIEQGMLYLLFSFLQEFRNVPFHMYITRQKAIRKMKP